ncbi:MAG TPA: hypothetical protein PKE03_00530 [Bacteroidales bacterium]|nr:hypothetical protein [Bacteroidales bacterium]
MHHHHEDSFTTLFRLVEGWFNQRLPDGGPRYAEYHPDLIIVEPWNAISSIFMMVPAIIFFINYRNQLNQLRFLSFAIAMVFLGGLGSTLFHAFRMSTVFLMLDVVPSALLTLAIAIYFWVRILPKWWMVLIVFVPVFLLRLLIYRELPQHLSINFSYAISGLLVIVPLLIILYNTGLKHWPWVVVMIAAFGIALLFRQLDAHPWPWLPQGTHFLWHLFTSVGSWFVLSYLHFLGTMKPVAPVSGELAREQ